MLWLPTRYFCNPNSNGTLSPVQNKPLQMFKWTETHHSCHNVRAEAPRHHNFILCTTCFTRSPPHQSSSSLPGDARCSAHSVGELRDLHAGKNHRIMGWKRTLRSSSPTVTTMPTKPYPKVPHLHVFWTPPGMVTQPLPWAACSNAWPLFQ